VAVYRLGDVVSDMSAFANIPDELQERDQWLLWDASADTPRRPHWNGNFHISWDDPDDWHSFDDAVAAAETRDSWGIGYVLAKDNDDYARGLYGCLDLDGCTQEPHGSAKEWLPSLSSFFEDDFYLEFSASGEGIHIPLVGQDVPEWWTDSHFDDREHEGVEFLTHKFCAFTGNQLRGSGNTVCDVDPTEFLRESYEAIHGEPPKVEQHAGDDSHTVTHSPSEVADIETTDDMDVLIDAVEHTKPRDIRIRSSVTQEFGGGKDINYARDPSWTESKSGTRIAEFDDGFVNRDGMYGLDCLQLVALEERIINRPDQYPEGEEFLDAVDALRDRGADIPEYEGDIGNGNGKNGNNDTPDFDAASGTADTDSEDATPGGETDETNIDGDESGIGYEDYIAEIIQGHSDEKITLKTARHRIAGAVTDEYNFVYPQSRVRGWRETLYVYNDDLGIYEPHGEAFLEGELERVAGDFVDNQLVTEIVSKVERRSRADRHEFTRRPERLVVGNGILNLHTGELDDYTPDEYHQQRIRVDWKPDDGNDDGNDDPEYIDSFLRDVVAPGDVPTMYRLVAHTLYREYIESKAAILLGNGQNGKSVFLEVIEHLLEPKYDTIARRELQDLDEYRFAANQLRGKLANLATEIGEQELTDTTTFKKLTGRDTMTADVKYESEVSFENHATLIFASNEMPVFSQDNHAIWRRWLLIEFPHEFNADDPSAKDPTDRDVLLRNLTTDAELEALLRRCQSEIERWHTTDEAFFADAASADEIREKMKKAAEPVFHFVTACLEPAEEDAYLKKDRVRACYRAFADEEDLPRIKQSEFGERLLNQRDLSISRGQINEGNGNRPRVYEAIQFSSRGRQLLGLDTTDDDDQSTVDGDFSQLKPQLLEIIRSQAAANDDEPVPRERVVWSAVSHDITKGEAERVVDTLTAEGEVIERDGELLPVDLY